MLTLPESVIPGCVAQAVYIPRDLRDQVSGPVTVKFAVFEGGSPGRFEVVTEGVDERVGRAIWNAVLECGWLPALDAQGRPVATWVILPLRFHGAPGSE